MAWRDQLQPASYRGAPFFVETADTAGGRKTIVHEYPFRNEAFAEDLGRRARSFRIDGYVIGPNYFADRDRLLEALESFGPGVLVHPYHGRKNVALAGPYGLRESKDEGGLARFSMEFVETASEAFAPPDSIAASAVTSASATSALAAYQRSVLRQYSTLLPTSGRTAPASIFSGVLSTLTNFNGRIRSALGPVLKDTQALASFQRQMDAIISAATSLVRTPVSMVTSLGLVFDGLLTGIRVPRFGIDALLQTYNFPSVVSSAYPSTPTAARGSINTQAIDTYIRRLAIVGATQLALSTVDGDGYDSYDDAVLVRRLIFDAMDADALIVVNSVDTAGAVVLSNDDDAFVATAQLRADLARALPGDAKDLPRILSTTPVTTVPSVVLAYQLYGRVDLADDIVARNGVPHPGFVPGGQALKVLSHA